MSRTSRSPEERERGRRVVKMLKARREEADLTAAYVSSASSIPVDTVRAIEGSRVLTPSFLTVAAMSRAIGLSLDELAAKAWEE